MAAGSKPNPQRLTKPFSFPAPLKGMNVVDPIASLGPEFATAIINMVCDGRGIKTRPGYMQYAIQIGAAPIAPATTRPGVRSLVSHQAVDPSNNAIFAVSSEGIFDITTGGSGPYLLPDEPFAIDTGKAGYGVFVNYLDDSTTTNYTFFADEDNGLYRYQDAGAWSQPTDIVDGAATDLSPDIVFCMVHKGRLWLVKRDSGTAYYLPAGQIAGTAAAFELSTKFPHGGNLVGIYSWSVDGGDGIDDYIVFLSSSGDIVIYRWTDPDVASTIDQTNAYYIGPPPSGRRVAASSGGELYILSRLGILPMTRLVSGRPVQEQDIYATRNITPLVRGRMQVTNFGIGWEMIPVTRHSIFILSSPFDNSSPANAVQFVQSFNTGGWSIFKGVPILCGAEYDGQFYFGGPDGIVYRMINASDNVLLSTSTGDSIPFNLVSSYSDGGEPAYTHRIQLLRAVMEVNGDIGYSIAARYDYDVSELRAIYHTVLGYPSTWNNSFWDSAIWGGIGILANISFSGKGIGSAMGFALTGAAQSDSLLLRADCMFDTGDFM